MRYKPKLKKLSQNGQAFEIMPKGKLVSNFEGLSQIRSAPWAFASEKSAREKQTNLKKQESLDLYFAYQKQTQAPIYTTYSKLDELSLITVGLASANRIRQWAEKTLPNGNVVGEVTNANTLHYKTLKPVKGGLFCERIFGPLKDFECACSSKMGKKVLKYKKAQKNATESETTGSEAFNTMQGTLDKILENKVLIHNTYAPSGQLGLLKNYKRFFCPECDVEYTWSVMRRYQLGYIKLNAPVTHVWYVKGNPSYISLLLDMKRKDVENIAYCNQNLTLENALKFSPETFSTLTDFAAETRPSELYAAWEKVATPFLTNWAATRPLAKSLESKTLNSDLTASTTLKFPEKTKKYKNVYYFEHFFGLKKVLKWAAERPQANFKPVGACAALPGMPTAYLSAAPMPHNFEKLIATPIADNFEQALPNLITNNLITQTSHNIDFKNFKKDPITPARLNTDGLTYYKSYFKNFQNYFSLASLEQSKRHKSQSPELQNPSAAQGGNSNTVKSLEMGRRPVRNNKLLRKLVQESEKLIVGDSLKNDGRLLSLGDVTLKLTKMLECREFSCNKNNTFLTLDSLKYESIISQKLSTACRHVPQLRWGPINNAQSTLELGDSYLAIVQNDLEVALRLINLFSTRESSRTSVNTSELRTAPEAQTKNPNTKLSVKMTSENNGNVFPNMLEKASSNKSSLIFVYLIQILQKIKLREKGLYLENISYNNSSFTPEAPTAPKNKNLASKAQDFNNGQNFSLCSFGNTQTKSKIILAALCTSNLKLLKLGRRPNNVKVGASRHNSLKNLTQQLFNHSFIFAEFNILKYLLLANDKNNTQGPKLVTKEKFKFDFNGKALAMNKPSLVPAQGYHKLLKHIVFLNRLFKKMETVLLNLTLENTQSSTVNPIWGPSLGMPLAYRKAGASKKPNVEFSKKRLFELAEPKSIMPHWPNLTTRFTTLNKSTSRKPKMIMELSKYNMAQGELRFTNGYGAPAFRYAKGIPKLGQLNLFSQTVISPYGVSANLHHQKSSMVSHISSTKSGLTKQIIINNIYCLSHRFLWEQEKDWYFFALYYYGFSNNLMYLQSSSFNFDDIAVPVYSYRNYDFSFLNTLFSSSSNTFVQRPLRGPAPTLLEVKKTQDFDPGAKRPLTLNKQNLHVSYSGAGMLKTLLQEFDFTELKKMDKQNRILLYDLNKYIRKIKKRLYGYVGPSAPQMSQNQTIPNLANSSEKLNTAPAELVPHTIDVTSTIKNNVTSSSVSSATSQDKKLFKDLCKQRDVVIRKTKLIRKVFINSFSNVGRVAASGNNVDESSTKNVNLNNMTYGMGNTMSNKLSSMILTTLPVLPPDLRPIVKMGTQIAASDLNRLYQRVIYRNDRLKRFLKDSITNGSYEMKYAQRLLQEAVDNLIQNGKSGVVPEKDARGRALKSLSDILKGKQGRFRQYLLGKRVDYSGRSVIVVGPKLKLHECGIPKEMALELFLPFLIKRILTENLARTVIGAKSLIKTNKPLVWALLREILKTNPVLLNRAPTLHRLGFQAFQPKLVDGRAILLHPLVCPAFNADFDGDQMAVHVPISAEARAEAWKLMLSRNNLLSPATGEPLVLPSQDMVLGCYYLTTNSNIRTQIYEKGYGLYFNSIADVLRSYNLGLINIHAIIWLKWNPPQKIETSTHLESPIEIRITEFGVSTIIYPKSYTTYKYIDKGNTAVNTVIRTTAGKILFNTIIQQSLIG